MPKPFEMNSRFKITLLASFCAFLFMQDRGLAQQSTSNHGSRFEQLGTLLPTPNSYRSMDGSAGPEYWQQQADYEIEAHLNTEELRLDGKELITYHNNSPNTLRYIWLQLDENEHAKDAQKLVQDPSSMGKVMSESALNRLEPWRGQDKFGCKVQAVTNEAGDDLPYSINGTMMRIDLPQPLKTGESFSFRVAWYYYLIDRINSPSWGRGGYEYFEKDDNYIFTVVQWFPRLAVYSDFEGWQNKQFVGRGEFALNFGNYVVKITLPDDYVVGATGECLNYPSVLSETEWERWEKARTASEPVEIVSLKEAQKREKSEKSEKNQTWIYKADNVRDFAWTASRKFIWDAMPHTTEAGKQVMCMSYFAKEAYPIYRRYSTKAVVHTLNTYSKYSIPYPYPTAISVEAANGMEYPMICFNPGRAEEDGTYTESQKNRAITVIIHEVGHNYFPMIINSDERQWAWFDEGINSFVQYLAEQEWDNHYPSRFGPARDIVDYMKLPKEQLEPIMTNSENIMDYGNNAYAKPAAGLNILRETIMGRELFDFAFKEYCRRWAFKHPTPADFFRTMEDASGVDLDWFWRGWFYSIDAVDISLDSLNWYKVDLENDPEPREVQGSYTVKAPEQDITRIRNREEGIQFAVDQDSSLQDFYYKNPQWESEDSVVTYSRTLYGETFTKMEKEERYGEENYYELFFSNKGGLVMPVIIEWTFEDGSQQIERIPVEIWRKNENAFSKVFVKDKKVTGIVIDPYQETADIDTLNNNWPEVQQMPTRFQVYRRHKVQEQLNRMQKAKKKKNARP